MHGAAEIAADPSALFSVQSLIALLTLTALEIVLGIDNIVFIAILTGRLPAALRTKAQRLGLGLAMFIRILLLLGIKWVMGLTATLVGFNLLDWKVDISGKDLILLCGGLFLIGKATYEIHEKMEEAGVREEHNAAKAAAAFGAVIVQILLIDIVFSLDSVITAVGMAEHIPVMIGAIVIAVGVMMVFAGPVSRFVESHPTLKILALAFLVLIGVMLVAEGFDKHIPKGYIYFAMAFSLLVEMVNLRISAKRKAAAGKTPQPAAG